MLRPVPGGDLAVDVLRNTLAPFAGTMTEVMSQMASRWEELLTFHPIDKQDGGWDDPPRRNLVGRSGLGGRMPNRKQVEAKIFNGESSDLWTFS